VIFYTNKINIKQNLCLKLIFSSNCFKLTYNFINILSVASFKSNSLLIVIDLYKIHILPKTI